MEVNKIKRKYYRLNTRIQAEKVRLISSEGKQIGVLTLSEALKRAEEQHLDVVEIVPDAKPPVCKLIDFRKFLYEKKREQKKSKKSSKSQEVKEIRFGPNIGPHDLKIRIERARSFLKENDKVKLTVQFKGREITHPEIGFEKLNEIINALTDEAIVEVAPERKGRFISALLMPK